MHRFILDCLESSMFCLVAGVTAFFVILYFHYGLTIHTASNQRLEELMITTIEATITMTIFRIIILIKNAIDRLAEAQE